jgi:hypothetical protein
MKQFRQVQKLRLVGSRSRCPQTVHTTIVFVRIQTVDVWQPKFQSIPLCAVDARISNLQFGSSLYKDGVHEAQLKS